MNAIAIARATLRANPGYELVLAEHLDAAERDRLGDLLDDDDCYGILRPVAGCGLAVRSCSPDTALLFVALTKPGPLPAFVRKSLGSELGIDRVVARLVHDGVLEVATAEGFRSGPRAAGRATASSRSAGEGRIGELSTAALRYGQALTELTELTEPSGPHAGALATRLYYYGRLPLSPELLRRMPNPDAVDDYLGVSSGGTAASALDRAWVQRPDTVGRFAVWRHWSPRSSSAELPRSTRSDPMYKLYVSPTVGAAPAAFTVVAESLGHSPGVRGLKVGCGVAGLCRTDKIVAYFDRLDDLRAGASRLAERTEGMAAHGVPFTAAITDDGLLSWGADPPRDWQPGMSWRMWVTGRLAEYLTTTGEADPTGLPPWQCALERVRLDGIDTDTWVPASGIWRDAGAASRPEPRWRESTPAREEQPPR